MTSTCARWPSAPASRPRPRASRRSAPPNCRRCARAKPAPRPDCSGSPMRANCSTARKSAPRSASPSSTGGCTQFAADIAREQQQTSDAEVALQRLDTEDAELKEEIKSRVEKRSGVDERVSEAEATLSAAERMFGELTTALADLTAKRNQLEAGVRTHRDRLARLDQEIAKRPGRRAEAQRRNRQSRRPRRARRRHGDRAGNAGRLRSRRTGQRDRPCRRAAEARSLPRPAHRGRQARAAAGDRSAHHLKARQRRDQESVAADHRRRHRRQGL